MEESRRQKRVASLMNETMGEIFQKNGVSLYGRAFVTITKVYVTPDLLVARFYLSVFNAEDKEKTLSSIRNQTSDLRNSLGQKLRNNLRRIPSLEFFLDESLDNVLRLEDIFKKDKEGKDEQNDDNS